MRGTVGRTCAVGAHFSAPRERVSEQLLHEVQAFPHGLLCIACQVSGARGALREERARDGAVRRTANEGDDQVAWNRCKLLLPEVGSERCCNFSLLGSKLLPLFAHMQVDLRTVAR